MEHDAKKKKNFKCRDCENRVYESKVKLSLHRECQHSGYPLGVCPLCRKEFPSAQSLSVHFRSCKNESNKAEEEGKGEEEEEADAYSNGTPDDDDDDDEGRRHRHARTKSDHATQFAAESVNDPREAGDRSKRTCPTCRKTFRSRRNMQLHISEKHESFICRTCGLGFSERLQLSRHIHRIHSPSSNTFTCHLCDDGSSFRNKSQLSKHLKTHQVSSWELTNATLSDDNPFVVESTAHNRFLRTYSAETTEDTITTVSAFRDLMHGHLTDLLSATFISMHGPFKVFVSLYVTFTDIKNSNELKSGFLLTRMRPIYSNLNAEQDATLIFEELNSQEETRAQTDIAGSQWILRSIDKIFVNVSKFKSYMGGGGKKRKMDLPGTIIRKHCLEYEKSEQHCLFHCIAKSKVLGDELSTQLISPETLSQYPPETKISEIPKLEAAFNIGINVYSYDEDHHYIFPVRINQSVELNDCDSNDKIVNVFLFNGHFHWIRNFNRFAGRRGKKENKFCFFCLNSFVSVIRCRQHMIVCRGNDPAALHLPPKTKDGKPPLIRFQNYDKCFWQPYIAYADFESLLVPGPANECGEKTTNVLHKHEVFAYAYVIIDQDGKNVFETMFVQDGVDNDCGPSTETSASASASNQLYKRQEIVSNSRPAAVNMLLSLFNVYRRIKDKLCTYLPLELTLEQEANFHEEDQCHICGEYFDIDDTNKVRDHDHLTGQYRGAAHESCNLNYRPSSWLTVFMHNLANYDLHPIMTAISHPDVKRRLHKVSVLPLTSEKYTTISIETREGARIRFADSLRFMNASLDSLSSALIKDSPLPLLEEKFPNTHHLLKGKQFFPYEHLKSIEVLDETELPPREAFHNSLTGCTIAEKDYEKALDTYDKTGCKSMRDYVKLYLWTDVFLLAEVFEKFRKTCHQVYKLDPAHYISTPQLAMDAALFKSKIKLELMTDIDQILFIQLGIRGGLSMISNRYSQANNPLMGKFYKPVSGEEDKYILYTDINNLYGTAMTMPLPVADFEWCKEDDFDEIHEQIRYADPYTGDKTGYILQVDLEYPERLHDLHNDLPLAPEKVFIDDSHMSDFQMGVRDGKRSKTRKLIPHLMAREKYVVHYAALQYYMKKGMVVTKTHRILKFTQTNWLKGYIDMNTDLRKESTSSFEKDLYKLFNNAVFGKTMENLWHRKEVKVCWNEAQLLKYSDKSWFRCFKIINTDLSLCMMKKKRILLNKPTYLGFTILDISKRMFYSNYYDGYKRMWPGDQMKLLMVDTDSYIMEISMPRHNSVYDDLLKISQNQSTSFTSLMLDCSNYDRNDENDSIRRLYSGRNARALGAVKDEMGSSIITEFVGLRPKLYGLKYLERPSHSVNEIIKAKGCPKNVLKRSFNFDHFATMLKNSQASSSANITMIRSTKHTLHTIVSRKRCLSIADDKRYISNDDHITTYAFGHKRFRGENHDDDDDNECEDDESSQE